MSTVSSTNTNSHYNPDEPRDPHGRWTTGGSSWRANPVRRPEPAGRAHLLLGHAHASAWHQGLIREFKLPTDAEAGQFARTLAAWNAASDLDPETFHETFTHDLVDKPATVARLRQAAAGAAQAQTIGEMVDASRPLTQAIRDIGAHRWDNVREGLADKAAAAMPMQFAAHVGTTAATVGTGLSAGNPPRYVGSSESDAKGAVSHEGKIILAGLRVGNPPTSSQDPTTLMKENFVRKHLEDAQRAADRLHVPVEFILGLSALESGWGKEDRFARDGNNFLNMHSPAPFATGSMAAKRGNAEVATYASYAQCLESFIARYGASVQGVTDPTKFLSILQNDRRAFGIDPDTEKPLPAFIPDTKSTIKKLIPIIDRIKAEKGL